MSGIHRQRRFDNWSSAVVQVGPCGFAPPTIPATFSPDVYCNGKNVVRFGDQIVPHSCLSCADDCSSPCSPHSGTYLGQHNVYANSRAIQVSGDPISCTDIASSRSDDTFVNS